MSIPEPTIDELFYAALGDACESEAVQELIEVIKQRIAQAGQSSYNSSHK